MCVYLFQSSKKLSRNKHQNKNVYEYAKWLRDVDGYYFPYNFNKIKTIWKTTAFVGGA